MLVGILSLFVAMTYKRAVRTQWVWGRNIPQYCFSLVATTKRVLVDYSDPGTLSTYLNGGNPHHGSNEDRALEKSRRCEARRSTNRDSGMHRACSGVESIKSPSTRVEAIDCVASYDRRASHLSRSLPSGEKSTS